MTTKETVELVAFDLDGTLVDSLRDLAESANALLGESGAAPLNEDAIGRMVGDGAATLVARVLARAGIAPPDALARFLAIYNARLLKCSRPYAGVATLLAALEGRVKLAVLTNKPLDATRRILDGLDLARYFPANRVVGGDGPFARKPDPAGLQWLAAADAVPLERTLRSSAIRRSTGAPRRTRARGSASPATDLASRASRPATSSSTNGALTARWTF